DHAGDVKVAARALRRPDADRFVGKAHVQAIAVRFRVDRHGADAKFSRGADDTQRNLAAIRDEDLAEHAYDGLTRKSASPYSTGWPFSTSLLTMMPATSDSISFISFIDS